MKKFLTFSLALFAAVCNLDAQVYLNDITKPVESRRYEGFSSKGKKVYVARYTFTGGFTLDSGNSGLVAEGDPGYAVFDLKGAYSKISFVMGPKHPNSANPKYDVIVTVRGDGRKLLDKAVKIYDAPKYYELDVTGVEQLRFAIFRGSCDLSFGEVRLWKAGQTPVAPKDPLKLQAGAKVKLVDNLPPYFIRHSGWVETVSANGIPSDWYNPKNISSTSINRCDFKSGLRFRASMEIGTQDAWSYFWLQKKYDKLSFIVGPCDNQSSNSSGWLTVKADNRIIYEKLVKQNELAQQVVLDVAGADVVSFHSEFHDGDFLGGLQFGVVDIWAYPSSDSSVPTAGLANLSKDKISKFPDVCPLMSSIEPFSVRGVSKADNTLFNGESDYYTFSMGGEQFSEGLILTTGNTLLFSDNIDSYAAFDLAGEYDWISFKAGCLTQHRVLGDDRLQVWADDRMVLDTLIHATWQNQYFEVPVDKCRILKFAKPGTGKEKQVYFGVGDIALYRGKPVANDLFYHEKPDCPHEADLIDLCKRPYFHYVGRYLSTLTNFDFNDCFKNGSSQKEYFQMKDGSKIYKGVMLETNIPLGLENVTVAEAAFLFCVGAGASIGSSAVGALTGVTAGVAGAAGGLASLYLFDDSGREASVAAFNPYGEYESCTFTVANKSEYLDSFDEIIGGRKQAPPVKLNVFADRHLVGEFWLDDKMTPTTYTVPIEKCTQLMFWLECGDVRSGQYVLYDMKVSKDPCTQPVPSNYTAPATTKKKASEPAVKERGRGKSVKTPKWLKDLL